MRFLQKEGKTVQMKHMKKMQSIRYKITPTQLWLKVVEITYERSIPFKNNIPRWGWLMWFMK
jgi:hypothetical protein